jgi:hypothetical protein
MQWTDSAGSVASTSRQSPVRTRTLIAPPQPPVTGTGREPSVPAVCHMIPHVPAPFRKKLREAAWTGVDQGPETGHFGWWRGGRVVEGAPLLRE